MKKFIIISILFISAFAKGQQMPLYDSYLLNPLLQNPAYAGRSEFANLFLLYRNQWAGIQGSPETQFISLDGRLKGEEMGLGGYIYNDISNIFSKTAGFLAYSYKIPLDSIHHLRAGMSIGFVHNRINFDRIQAQNPDEASLLNANQSDAKPDGSFGMYYEYDERLEVGLAIQQLFRSSFTYVNQADESETAFTLLSHYYLTAAYSFKDFVPDFNFKPFTQLRSTQSLPIQWDLGVQTTWKKKWWLSAMYRSNYGVAIGVGGKINSQINLAYTYEAPTNGIAQYSSGSHEVGLNITLLGGSGKGGGGMTPDEVEMHKEIQQHVKEMQHTMDSLDRHIVEIRDEAEAHADKIDSIWEVKLQLKEQLAEQEERLDVKQAEIEKLKEIMRKDRTQIHDFVVNETVNPDDVDSLDSRFEYYVVVGTYTEYNYAKFVQNLLKREYKEVTTLTPSNDYYLVWTKKVVTKQEALQEIARLNALINLDYLNEGAWLYHKRK